MDTTQTAPTTNKLLLIIVAFLMPPLAVGLKTGINKTFVLSVILTLLFFVPGLIHAILVVL